MGFSRANSLKLALVGFLIVAMGTTRSQVQRKESKAIAIAYPAPRWPSYLKKPK
jgi:hypothetical protein